MLSPGHPRPDMPSVSALILSVLIFHFCEHCDECECHLITINSRTLSGISRINEGQSVWHFEMNLSTHSHLLLHVGYLQSLTSRECWFKHLWWLSRITCLRELRKAVHLQPWQAPMITCIQYTVSSLIHPPSPSINIKVL